MFIRATILTLAATILVCGLNAAEKDDLPPGLRKKDKLPPGQVKKQQREAAEQTPAVPPATATATNLGKADSPTAKTPPPKVAATNAVAVKEPLTKRQVQELRASLDKHAGAINSLDNKPAALKAGFAAIEKETGVSPAALQKQHREHPAVGTTGLLMANEMASQTKKPVGTFLNQHQSGKKWADIAADHKVDLEVLDATLNRVEQAMRATR